MFKDLDAGQTRSFEPSAHEQAGNVNSPVAKIVKGNYSNRLQWATDVCQDNSVVGTKLYAIPKGYCIVDKLDYAIALSVLEGIACCKDGSTVEGLKNLALHTLLTNDYYQSKILKGSVVKDYLTTASPMNVPPQSTKTAPNLIAADGCCEID